MINMQRQLKWLDEEALVMQSSNCIIIIEVNMCNTSEPYGKSHRRCLHHSSDCCSLKHSTDIQSCNDDTAFFLMQHPRLFTHWLASFRFTTGGNISNVKHLSAPCGLKLQEWHGFDTTCFPTKQHVHYCR